MPEETAPSENTRKAMAEIDDLIKESFGNPNAFAIVAVVTATDDHQSSCQVRFLSQGRMDPPSAYVAAMMACHRVAEEKLNWPEGSGPMTVLRKAMAQNPGWGQG